MTARRSKKKKKKEREIAWDHTKHRGIEQALPSMTVRSAAAISTGARPLPLTCTQIPHSLVSVRWEVQLFLGAGVNSVYTPLS